MTNSLYSGVSGLNVSQQMLDVIGNNLANSNTTGYKDQRVTFQDTFYQTLAEGTNPASADQSGTNPVQIGVGVKVGTIDTVNTQGDIQSTGRDLDVALQGNGYFVARSGATTLYTRAGAFGVDADNFLVDPSTGDRIQRYGTVGEGSATSPAFQVAGDGDIKIPTGETIPGKATTTITLQGNLDATATGAEAQVLTASSPLQSGGAAATSSTLLNSLDDNTADYAGTDQLQIQGVDSSGSAVNASLAVGPTTTVGDLISAINTNFPGSTASLDASGNLVIQSKTPGPSTLALSITDAAGNTGSTNWANHTMAVTTDGKVADTVRTSMQVYDAQGSAHTITLDLTKTSGNTWDMTASMPPSDGVLVDNSVKGITFNADGSFSLVSGAGGGNASLSVQFTGEATPQQIGFSFGTSNGFNGLTSLGGDSSASAIGQDGYASGGLTSVSIGQDGVITGNFSNGRALTIAQIAVANFANPGGLDRVGDNYYSTSAQSGAAVVGAAQSGGRGSVQQESLESSNVDIATEFTLLIIAQRGFEANAKAITATDEMLQDLTNIIR